MKYRRLFSLICIVAMGIVSLPVHAMLDLQKFSSLQELDQLIEKYRADSSVIPDDERGHFLAKTDCIYLPASPEWNAPDSIKEIDVSLYQVHVYYDYKGNLAEFGYKYLSSESLLDEAVDSVASYDGIIKQTENGNPIYCYYKLDDTWCVWEQDGNCFYWRFHYQSPDAISYDTMIPWCDVNKLEIPIAFPKDAANNGASYSLADAAPSLDAEKAFTHAFL